MKLEKLVGDRFKEKPSDCVVDSHALMIRGGYMKYVANGIYSSYTPLRRITHKIEEIIRQEMEAIDGQEVQFPVVLPGSLWEESGRYESVGKELMRFRDRNNSSLVLGMTHEEAAVHLVREYAQSYTKYPFMIYQIQTKFRDEARPRAGLIRVREFTMKDAYSFHTSQEDLETYYQRCLKAYHRIYKRVGLPEVIAVASDSGMMGGSVSHEFMLLTPIGEDSIAICPDCGYCANMEAAENILPKKSCKTSEPLALVHTPDIHTIEEVCEFLHSPKEQSCKAVVYQKNADDSYVVLFIRGDLEVNETKLTNYLKEEIHPAVITPESGLHAGYIGPYDLQINDKALILYDRSLEGAKNLSCGANQEEYHYTGLDMERELPDAEYHDFAKIQEGGICPHCGKTSITISRGIEVGNIFQLGTKYTRSMNMTYIDENGKTQYPVMGCYGIGIGRLAAAVCEAHHDEYGPIWPMSIAPWQIHLCAVRSDDAQVKVFADQLYEELLKKGVEVVYDDRTVRAGVMFSDADLLGVPLRVVVSPRNLKQNQLEVVSRDKTFSENIPAESAAERLMEILKERR
ncbi:proline--tRNA ligase [Blautia sp.]|uniref:proline--tRNA ligase n=1 Tax=Blautia sp. TaxID=1955243 RepID=UPI002E796319|nr:proline--tRNA ligase [Blautia sp.]MEE0810258.1 proline--tRNA ligase [Blautia sp.]